MFIAKFEIYLIIRAINHGVVVTPGLLQKMSKKCNSLGKFPGLVVFLAVFFRKFDKNRKMKQSPEKIFLQNYIFLLVTLE